MVVEAPELWVRFLGGRSANEARPRLCLKDVDGEIELVIKPRDRTFIAALAVPRAMASQGDGEGRELPVLSSQEICDRTSSDRSIIGRALGDLESIFSEQGLRLDDYIFANKESSQYGLRGAHVDVVDLLAAGDAHDDANSLLASSQSGDASTGLTGANRTLFNTATLRELDALLGERVERCKSNGADDDSQPDNADSSARELEETPEPDRAPAEPPTGADAPLRDTPPDRPPGRRLPGRAIAFCSTAAVAAVIAVAIAITDGNRSNSQSEPGSNPTVPGRFEITGGPARTWSNYQNAGGTPGRSLTNHQRLYVTCRLRGFQAGGTNVWWYRLGEPPWSNRFYATADAFYNNGHGTGPLKGTPKVDARVPLCPS
jgi:hypothetical protein